MASEGMKHWGIATCSGERKDAQPFDESESRSARAARWSPR
ncbi:hypothetical protein AKJ09_02142 [Labilithrix luteola]|uniref:Uncharacterized protein n=1 Tax=Labilithrix luteola TaxID=1391654 RepID=A0A0K1PPM9_9BACT|nr:hypothetical protein AKJ09_02142 [Labilithrix luteola]